MVDPAGTTTSPVLPIPDPFTPNTVVLQVGTILHRVYGNKRQVTEFNPGGGPPTRFAFFGAKPVPVLYAANDLKAAVCESILHEIPAAGGVLLKPKYEDRVSSGIKLTKPLTLAVFHGEGLRALGVDQCELTTCEAKWYPDTVKWAEAAYNAGFDGCVWMSRALNTALSYVFFDREDAIADASADVVARAYLNGPDLDWLINFCGSIKIDVEV